MFESIRQVFDAGQDISELSVLPVLQSNMAKDRMEVDTAMSLMMALPIVYTSTWVAALRNVRNKFLQRKMIHATRSMLEKLQMPLASAEDIKVCHIRADE